MKTRLTFATSFMCSYFLLFAGQAMAAKPLDVLERSNVYPSGAHLNLNINGKDAKTYTCATSAGGNTVFINEYGESTIQHLTKRISGMIELTALVPCAEVFDGSPALVQIAHGPQG